MRLRVCLGIIMLGLGACTTLPGLIRIDVDGSTVELKRKPEQPAPELAAPDPQQPDSQQPDSQQPDSRQPDPQLPDGPRR